MEYIAIDFLFLLTHCSFFGANVDGGSFWYSYIMIYSGGFLGFAAPLSRFL